MRLLPCCWISGSDTPSALTRLRSVARFWRMVFCASSRIFSGLIFMSSTKRLPVLGPLLSSRSGYSVPMASIALLRSASERSTATTPLSVCETEE